MSIPGRLVVSFDFELGWGILDSPIWRLRQQQGVYRRLREVFNQLVGLLAATRLPTTWGVVSSSFVERESDLALNHLPVPYADAVRAFFHEAEWETRCSIDLFDRWSAIGGFSELSSHSSTHLHADYPGLDAAAWVRDILDSCDAIERRYGRTVRSVIFPRDQARFRLELAAVRPMHYRLSPAFMLPAGGWRHILARTRLQLGAIPAMTVAEGRHGETYQSGSLFFNWPAGRGEWLRQARLERQQARLLAALERGGGSHHVWLHPFNLARTPRHYELFAGFLSQVARLRDSGKVEVLTMEQAGSR